LRLGLRCVELEWSMSYFGLQWLCCHLKFCLGIGIKPACCYQQKAQQHCLSSFFPAAAKGVGPALPPSVSSQSLGSQKFIYIRCVKWGINHQYIVQRKNFMNRTKRRGGNIPEPSRKRPRRQLKGTTVSACANRSLAFSYVPSGRFSTISRIM
jgi:hypothetical protein